MNIQKKIHYSLLLIILSMVIGLPFGRAQRDSIPDDYPHSLQQDRDSLMKALAKNPKNPGIWKQLAEVYMNMGDDLMTEKDEKIAIYKKGAAAADAALKIHETDAETHFFIAANLGNAAKLQGFAVGGLQLPNIIKHVDRAIELDPHHAPSLQFKGGLLAELPWYLGGNEQLAQEYLQKAISIDGNFTNARIILAKLLLKAGHIDQARTQLLQVIQADRPHYPYTWARKFRPAAQQLLQTFPRP